VKDTNTTKLGQIIQPEEVVVGSWYNREERSTEVSLLDPNFFEKTCSLYNTQSVDALFTAFKIAQHLSLKSIL